jgi:hypothetical protein
VSPPFGKNLMGFYQEIISMFILYWVPVLYILGQFCILGAKIWDQKVSTFWPKFDGILPRKHINVHPILGACTLCTEAILHTRV